MSIKIISFLLISFLLLFSTNVSLIAHECDPPCEGCESCEAGVCVDDPDNCIPCQNCVDAECMDDDDLCFGCERCSSSYCIDDNSQCATCDYCVGGLCIPVGYCHNTSECDNPNCESCIDCECTCIGNCCTDMDCGPILCWDCDPDDCECYSSCSSNQCCDPDAEPWPMCVDKCNPVGGPCPYTHPIIQAGCQRQSRDDHRCYPDQVGKTCMWISQYEHSTSAACVACAPDCGRTRDEYCAFWKAETCRNKLVIGCSCDYNGPEDEQPAFGDGDHYICN